MRTIDADVLGLTDMEIIMCKGDYKEALKMLIDKIDNAPTITPERKRGRWETIEQQPYFRKHYKRICCSECKRRSKGDIKWNFCPNCGADMSEGEE